MGDRCAASSPNLSWLPVIVGQGTRPRKNKQPPDQFIFAVCDAKRLMVKLNQCPAAGDIYKYS